MAHDVNRVMIIGRLTRDMGNGFAYNPNGVACANVSIASNRSQKKGDEWVEEVSYFDITIWGKTAESLRPYLTKGKQIAVDGTLRQDRWEKDGEKYQRIRIVAEAVQLLGGGNGTKPPAPENEAGAPPDDWPFQNKGEAKNGDGR